MCCEHCCRQNEDPNNRVIKTTVWGKKRNYHFRKPHNRDNPDEDIFITSYRHSNEKQEMFWIEQGEIEKIVEELKS